MDRLYTLASSCCCSQGYAAVKHFDSMSMWYQWTGGFDFRFSHCLCDSIGVKWMRSHQLRNNFSIAQVSMTFVIGISLQPLPNVILLQIFSKNLEKGVVLIRRRVCVRFLVVFLDFLIIIILQRENLSPREPEHLRFDLIPGGCNHLWYCQHVDSFHKVHDWCVTIILKNKFLKDLPIPVLDSRTHWSIVWMWEVTLRGRNLAITLPSAEVSSSSSGCGEQLSSKSTALGSRPIYLSLACTVGTNVLWNQLDNKAASTQAFFWLM